MWLKSVETIGLRAVIFSVVLPVLLTSFDLPHPTMPKQKVLLYDSYHPTVTSFCLLQRWQKRLRPAFRRQNWQLSRAILALVLSMGSRGWILRDALNREGFGTKFDVQTLTFGFSSFFGICHFLVSLQLTSWHSAVPFPNEGVDGWRGIELSGCCVVAATWMESEENRGEVLWMTEMKMWRGPQKVIHSAICIVIFQA